MNYYYTGKCNIHPDATGSCPPGYRIFKTKNGLCCRKVTARDAPCPKTRKDRKGKRRFISPISGKCVTLAGKIRAQSRLDALQAYGGMFRPRTSNLPGDFDAPMSGDEPLGDYASEAGIQFFGRKRRKGCDRRKKKCYKNRPSRYRKAGAPCGGKKRKDCRSTPGCSYVKRRGCRRNGNYAKLIAMGMVPQVNMSVAEAGQAAAAAAEATGAPTEAVAAAAAAGAADAAEAEVLSVGGTPAEAADAAVAAAEVAAEATGAPPEAVQAAVQAVAAAPPPPPPPPGARRATGPIAVGGLAEMVAERARARAQAKGITLFGRRRRMSRFGSVCTDLRPKDTSTCLNYRDSNGMYPCNWSGGANSRCQSRPGGAVPYSLASTTGKYMSYVMAITPSLASMTPPPTPTPIAPSLPPPLPPRPLSQINYPPIPTRGLYDCVGRSIANCGSNPNCQWQSGGNPPKCVRRKGHLQGDQYEGPMLESGFGRRRRKSKRYNVKGSGCQGRKKRDCNKPVCSYTKRRGCRRGVGSKAAGLAFGKKRKMYLTSFGKKRKMYLTSFGKKKRRTTRRKGCKSKGVNKKLPAKVRKMCRKLKIKTTKKVGRRRACKSLKTIMAQIRKKMKKMKKARKVHRRRR